MSSETTQTQGIAERYAGAFFDLMAQDDALETAEENLLTLKATIQESDDFAAFLKSPVYKQEDQEKAIAAIAQKTNLAPLTCNFLALIARNRRLFALENIIQAFQARLAAHRGEISAEATSAIALNPDQTRRLRSEIETIVGKAVNLNTQVDPDLLGGLIVKVGSVMIDSSLKTKLNRLKSVMKEA